MRDNLTAATYNATGAPRRGSASQVIHIANYDSFHCKYYTPEIFQIQKLKFFGTNSKESPISIYWYLAVKNY